MLPLPSFQMDMNLDPRILPQDGEAILYPHFFDREESDAYFERLQKETKWVQEPILIFGKWVMQPRLTAWYGEPDKEAQYSGIKMKANPWTPTLLEIKTKVEAVSGKSFTSCLLNQYRDGKDSVAWHRDNERELGKNPEIASVSFGATRKFKFKHYFQPALQKSVELTHGSLLLMKGTTQHYWQHCIPKTNEKIGPRINLTFRVL